MPFLDEAADKFDFWVTYNEDPLLSDDELLVRYLDADGGFQYIKSYGELCQLASLVKAKGYQTTNPPCTPKEYNQAIEKANPESCGGTRPVKAVETLTSLCVEFLTKNSGIFEQQSVTPKQQEVLTKYFDIALKNR